MTSVKEYVVKSLSLPKDVVEELEAHRQRLEDLSGVHVSLSAAAVNLLRSNLGLSQPSRKAKKGARSDE